MKKNNKTIAIIGLGYVGLPLAVEFGKKYQTIGYDIDKLRVKSLKDGIDETLEVSEDDLKKVLIDKDFNNKKHGLYPTIKVTDLKSADIFIITVPTPIDKNKNPILLPLKESSKTVGGLLKNGDIVIYESTVYPGLTEEICVPILEKSSNLTFNTDFFVGYSPERINPGDKKRTVTKIKKVTSGSTPIVAKEVDSLYNSIITAGTHLAPSIKVAEAAKVIENSQRDINIAFVNELSKIFNLLKIDTHSVLEAASTKWNFLPYVPGLVGGHCIGVDPYYLAQKAQEVGYHPEVILSGRRINDSMGAYVSDQFIKSLIDNKIMIKDANVLILGFTFKENCPDIRNTGVINVYKKLIDFSLNVYVYDPWADEQAVKENYNIPLLKTLGKMKFDGIILTVAHDLFKNFNISNLKSSSNSVVFDVKGILNDYTHKL